MKLKSNLYFFFIFSKILFGNVEFVSFGWEAFDYITDARSSALGNSNIAYKFDNFAGTAKFDTFDVTIFSSIMFLPQRLI